MIDSRLLHHLAELPGSWVARGEIGAEQTAVLRLEGDPAFLDVINTPVSSLLELAQKSLQQQSVRELPLTDVPSYIRKLRRDLPVYLFRIVDPASRNRAERFLFWSNYKGSTDFFTKYVYPPLVWQAVRPLARWRIHPNVVSLFNIGITVLAVPLFAQGYWVTAFTLAYTMSVLDSVDGKLARLTFSALQARRYSGSRPGHHPSTSMVFCLGVGLRGRRYRRPRDAACRLEWRSFIPWTGLWPVCSVRGSASPFMAVPRLMNVCVPISRGATSTFRSLWSVCCLASPWRPLS